MLKKIGCLAVALIMLLSFAACEFPSLDAYKNSSKNNLDSYAQKAKDDCIEECFAAIDELVAEGKDSIDSAQSRADVLAALNKAKQAIDDAVEIKDVSDTHEIILLADLSFSSRKSIEQKSEFIKSAIDACPSEYSMGIVTFGRNQIYAAQLNADIDGLYQKYLDAVRPDDSATDIASALVYASTLFTKPQSGKIVLISDGVETDNYAMSAVMTIAAQGITVDTVHFPDDSKNDVQIIDIGLPDYNVAVGENVKIAVTIQSNYFGTASITLYNNGVKNSPTIMSLNSGIQVLYVDHTFLTAGANELRAEITSQADTVAENNSYYSYVYLETFDKILILDGGNESAKLNAQIKDDYNVTIMDIDDAPKTVNELQQFDEVILMNVANADMPTGFDALLYSYVFDYGGGVFTVGGNKVIDDDGNEVPNAYNKADMNPEGEQSLYQRMLPVECIDYTPSLAVMLVIDRSGSMVPPFSKLIDGKSRMDLAKEAAAECVNALTERDYAGVISFAGYNDAREDIGLTPQPQKAAILHAISNIEAYGGTVYTNAIKLAGEALLSVGNVERKHIIFVTDGEPEDSASDFEAEINYYYKKAGITFSTVDVGNDYVNVNLLMRMAELGHGRHYLGNNVIDLPRILREEVTSPEIREYIPTPFIPLAYPNIVTAGIVQSDIPELDGLYGTRAKSVANVPLTGPYGAPIYAQWKFGKGRVGSIMTDLNGNWSDEFLKNSVGQTIIKNIIKSLMPTENIRPTDIEVDIIPDNYNAKLLIYTSLSEGDNIEVSITDPSNNITVSLAQMSGVLTYLFNFNQSGVYKITVQKKDSSGAIIAKLIAHAAFSYSAEYNANIDAEAGLELLTDLAYYCKGSVLTNAAEVFR